MQLVTAIIAKLEVPEYKKWLKTREVVSELRLSQGTLQTMRKLRQITYSKVGGSLYYHVDHLAELIEENKIERRNGGKRK